MTMKIQVLGSGMEVGRSCLSVDDSTLLDCGILMSEELDPVPADYFPKVKRPNRIRNIFISHAHLDHSGYLPFLLRSGFQGNVYCIRPTKDLLRVLYTDSIKLAKGPWAGLDESILDVAMDIITPVEYEEDIPIPGGFVRFIKSHHILGSALTYLEKGDRRILYTSDFSAGSNRCFRGVKKEIRNRDELVDLDAIFIESTYGDTARPPRNEREDYLLHAVIDSMEQGRRVFLPSFALGRAQELERIFIENRAKIPFANIHADGMIREMNRIHNRYEDYMDTQFPLLFREVTRSVRDQVLNDPQGIVITTSGFCEGGPIRFYLDTASDGDTVIFSTSYSPRESMADRIKTSGSYEGRPLNVEEVDLSAHSSYL
ncbi:MAG: MBL fold metallo-hydrolase, partial [Theionarchaea archaeon]|nr:MBL fold metallo-hydrolase [Theionarchaea archaeon]